MPEEGAAGDVPRMALSKAEAARALGVSDEFFDKHIAPEVPSVQRGRRRLYSVDAIKDWLRTAGGGSPSAVLIQVATVIETSL